VFELLVAGGPVMVPLTLCSIAVMAISIECLLRLRPRKVLPSDLLSQGWRWFSEGQMTPDRLRQLRLSSPLGAVLAAGFGNADKSRDVINSSVASSAGQVIHLLERHLTSLNTIAYISPLLGLLGTVFGMIQVFNSVATLGPGNSTGMAGGISEALITTAAGLFIAIPSTVLHRFFNRRIDTLALQMEVQANALINALVDHQGTPTSEQRAP